MRQSTLDEIWNPFCERVDSLSATDRATWSADAPGPGTSTHGCSRTQGFILFVLLNLRIYFQYQAFFDALD